MFFFSIPRNAINSLLGTLYFCGFPNSPPGGGRSDFGTYNPELTLAVILEIGVIFCSGGG
jgi:hypothetical protein